MAFCDLARLRPPRAGPQGEKRANVFERYTEKARRVIFFARYEASQYGSPYIETEHLLLGLMREDKALANRFLRQQGSIESIRKEIEARITIRERISTSVEVPLSAECKRILNMAAEEAERLGVKHVGTEHLLLGILREEKCFGAEILMERGLRLPSLREELARTSGEKTPASRPKETSLLSEFSRDLTSAAAEGSLDPLVGREGEVDRVIQILCRRTKNNPVLIGEPGVGKTAIVEGLAQRIADSDVPPFLADKQILSLDLSLIVAGTKYRGQFEERLKTIMKELMESQNSIVFIDELHTLVGAGSAEGSLDAANIFKPALSRGEIQCIGATTPGEYRKSIEKDRSLERRFQAVKSRHRTRPMRSRFFSASKTATRSSTPSPIPTTPSTSRSRIRTAIFPTASCPTRRSTWLTKPARVSSYARLPCRKRSRKSRSASNSSSTVWRTPSRTTSSRRRASTRTKNARSARTCAPFAKNTTSMNPPPALSVGRTSRTWYHAGPAFPSPRSKKKRRRSCCALKKSCTSGLFLKTSLSARWLAPSAARAP